MLSVDLVSDPKLLILHSHRHGVFSSFSALVLVRGRMKSILQRQRSVITMSTKQAISPNQVETSEHCWKNIDLQIHIDKRSKCAPIWWIIPIPQPVNPTDYQTFVTEDSTNRMRYHKQAADHKRIEREDRFCSCVGGCAA